MKRKRRIVKMLRLYRATLYPLLLELFPFLIIGIILLGWCFACLILQHYGWKINPLSIFSGYYGFFILLFLWLVYNVIKQHTHSWVKKKKKV